jgi:glycerol-3-phosphate dehydrogenase
VFGGKITTFRKLAEHALDRLKPFFPQMGGPWTAGAPLPGGDMPDADFEAFLRSLVVRYPWLPLPLALHYARLYGTRAERVLAGAGGLPDLGRHFGAGFYEREALYLIEGEWAETAEDVLERRTKHGLHLTPDERRGFQSWLAEHASTPRAAAE